MGRCHNCAYHSETVDTLEVCMCDVGSEFHFICCNTLDHNTAKCPYHEEERVSK